MVETKPNAKSNDHGDDTGIGHYTLKFRFKLANLFYYILFKRR